MWIVAAKGLIKMTLPQERIIVLDLELLVRHQTWSNCVKNMDCNQLLWSQLWIQKTLL